MECHKGFDHCSLDFLFVLTLRVKGQARGALTSNPFRGHSGLSFLSTTHRVVREERSDKFWTQFHDCSKKLPNAKETQDIKISVDKTHSYTCVYIQKLWVSDNMQKKTCLYQDKHGYTHLDCDFLVPRPYGLAPTHLWPLTLPSSTSSSDGGDGGVPLPPYHHQRWWGFAIVYLYL